MVLLTSSQVNVAISSGIVILFTTALFLSGYAIQQRTVRHLRAAIRPDNTPQLYLPDRFHDDTTELEDGTIVMLDEYNRPVRMKNGRISIGQGESVVAAKDTTNDGTAEGVVIEVKETLPEILGDEEQGEGMEQQQQQKVLAEEEMIRDSATVAAETSVAEGQDVSELPQQLADEASQDKTQQPELEDLVPNPNDENQKPVSRAERRRLIKEEIRRLAQGEQPVYYQRRLW